MSKAVRTNRVPIMLTDAELAEVDAFRFDRRIATRSEAIRCLVLLGITQSQLAERVEAIVSRASRGRSVKKARPA